MKATNSNEENSSIISETNNLPPHILKRIKDLEVVKNNIILSNDLITSYSNDKTTNISMLKDLVLTLKKMEPKIQKYSINLVYQ